MNERALSHWSGTGVAAEDLEKAIRGLKGPRQAHQAHRDLPVAGSAVAVPGRAVDLERDGQAQEQRHHRFWNRPVEEIIDRGLTWACRLSWLELALYFGVIGGVILFRVFH